MTDIKQAVQDKYAAVAESTLTSSHAGVHAIAEAFGYSAEELSSIPAEANMGLSCGNPIATAHLKPGEVVVDLGSGGGLDVFLAANKVGETGKAIGIDMTAAMIDRAHQAALKHGLKNVEFHLATIDDIPLPNESVDCVISNCVINLAEDKGAVFREIFRVLKPGGRLAVSDIALTKSLPAEIKDNVLAYISCIAGAIPVEDYSTGLKAAGFPSVQVIHTNKDLNAYSEIDNQIGCCAPPEALMSLGEFESNADDSQSCCSPAESALHQDMVKLIQEHDLNDFAASIQVYAIKAV